MKESGPKADAIFVAALGLPREQRAAYLDRVSAGDAELRQRIEAMLRAQAETVADAGDTTVTLRLPGGALAPALPSEEQSGARIGRYKLLQQIGEGGMGTVWMAEQVEPVRRQVALKVIRPGMDSRQILARFEAERQALALMDHPNIAKVLDAGATPGGRPFFVMELVKGVPITKFCDEHQLSIPERLGLFTQVCHAIQHAHQKGIIHRDVKPSNVLVALYDGRPVPKVIDFGVAKATGQALTERTLFTEFGAVIGTPEYMSPEQAEMNQLDIDTRSDIYSLGVLLYELLTGSTPLSRETLRQAAFDEILRRIREEEPPKPSTRLSQSRDQLPSISAQRKLEPAQLTRLLQGDLDWIVLKTLEKDRTRRYETANGLAMDIQRHLANEPVVARAPTPAYRFQKMVRRNKLAFASAGAVVTVLVLGILASAWQAVRATNAERDQTRLRLEAEKAQANEAKLRLQSEAAEETARSEARRAEVGATEAKMALAASDFLQAVRLVDEGNGTDALPYLIRCLTVNPKHHAALTRMVSLLSYHTWMIPVLSLKHSNAISSAQFSPDGRWILTASGNSASMWDAQSGRLLTQTIQHGGVVASAQFSADGARIVTASADGSARVWDARSGKPLTKPLTHGDGVLWAQFNPEGTRIVTASADGTARVWDAQSGSAVTTLPHSNRVVWAQFSPDGKRIVTASSDTTARVWDARSGKALTSPLAHGYEVSSARFSPHGGRIVTTSGTSALVWDAQTGETRTGPLHFDIWGVFSAQFNPDGTRVLTASGDKTARVWDAQTGRALIEPLQHGNWVLNAKFSLDGKRIVTASADGTARVWDALNGHALTEPLEHGEWVLSAEFSPDGKQIVTTARDNIVRVWSVQSKPALTESLRHSGALSSAQFSPDGSWIVTASGDNTARVWDASTGQALTGPLSHTGLILSARFSPDGKQVVTASRDNTARVWDAQNGHPLTEPLEHGSWVFSAEFSPDGKEIVTASGENSARLWDAQSGRVRSNAFGHNHRLNSARFSPDGNRIVTASDDSTARVWDAHSGQPVTQPLKHSNYVLSAQFSPDGKRVVTASVDGTARVWNAQSGQPMTEPLRHSDWVYSAQYSPDGKRIVTASRDNTAQVWDSESGEAVTDPLQHGGYVFSAQFSPDSSRVVTSSQDFTARVWDSQTGQPLTESLNHNNWVMRAEFSPDGKRIVTASYDSTAQVWDMTPSQSQFPDWLLKLAEAVSGQRLNPRGILESKMEGRVEFLAQLRQRLRQSPDDNDWLVWGRWFLTDPSMRTISPFSKVTVAEHAEHQTKETTPEAEQSALKNVKRISQARRTEGDVFSEKYSYPRGHFGKLKSGGQWFQWAKSDTGKVEIYRFKEFTRDENAILLKDASRNISIELPVNGGMSRLSNDDGTTWQDLYELRKE